MQQSILSQATPQETQVVKHDSFDRATFQEMKESAEALAEVQVNGMKELTTFEPLFKKTLIGPAKSWTASMVWKVK